MASFRRKQEPLRKKGTCSCGGDAKLIKRTNYPHGRKSGGVCFTLYKCGECGKETFAKASDQRPMR